MKEILCISLIVSGAATIIVGAFVAYKLVRIFSTIDENTEE